MCCVDKVLSFSLSGSGWGQLEHLQQRSTSSVGIMAGWCSQEGVANSAISAPKVADFFFHLFRVGLLWHTIGIYHDTISAFLELNLHHTVLNHPIISKLMHAFFAY